MNQIQYFPKEMIETIFSFVNVSDLVRCVRVCNHWKEIIYQNSFFLTLIRKFGNMPTFHRESVQKLSQRKIKSLNEFIFQLNKFVGEIRTCERGRFTCFFLYNPECEINVDYRIGGSENPHDSIQKAAVCFYQKQLQKTGLKTEIRGKLIADDIVNPPTFDCKFEFYINLFENLINDEISISILQEKIKEIFKNDLCQFSINGLKENIKAMDWE